MRARLRPLIAAFTILSFQVRRATSSVAVKAAFLTTTTESSSASRRTRKKPQVSHSFAMSKRSLLTSSSSPSKKSKKLGAEETSSFDPIWAGTVDSLKEKDDIQIHTLILGTHPSIRSLEEGQNFGHPMNTFWWIAGDCLGFRRQSGISPSTGKPYKFASSLRYGEEHIKTYEEQTTIFCSNGFAMWDVVKTCKREGSLDQDIQEDVPNDIRGFCKDHPSIRRIVLANGGTGAQFFRKHFKDWFDSGEIVPSKHKASQTAFKKWASAVKDDSSSPYFSKKIVVISALAVSPAAARYTYEEKRDFWEEEVYKPGLADHKRNTRTQKQVD